MSQGKAGTKRRLRRGTQTHPDERPCVPTAVDGPQVIERRPRSSVSAWCRGIRARIEASGRRSKSDRREPTAPTTMGRNFLGHRNLIHDPAPFRVRVPSTIPLKTARKKLKK